MLNALFDVLKVKNKDIRTTSTNTVLVFIFNLKHSLQHLTHSSNAFVSPFEHLRADLALNKHRLEFRDILSNKRLCKYL